MSAVANEHVPANEPVIEFTRLLEAPRELVWEVFTDPAHLARWWGPNGFSITTNSHNMRQGGIWDFIMHGPDGVDYDNIITYEEITKPERLVYRHGGPGDLDQFHVTITLTREATKTRLVMQTRFPSVAARDRVIKEVGAVEGGRQTLSRLTGYLNERLAAGPIVSPGTIVEFTRVFDAPRDLVFKVWTEAKHVQKWWGPAGSDNGETRIDARPGGEIHVLMRGPGFEHPMGGEFLEVDPPKRLVFLSKAFQNPDSSWQFVNHNTVTFEEVGGKTRVNLHVVVQRASKDVEVPVAGMKEGWRGSLDRLHDLLAKLQ